MRKLKRNRMQANSAEIALITTSLMDLGIRSLKAVLKRRGFCSELYLLDTSSVKYTRSEIRQIIKALEEQAPKIIGISTVELSECRTKQLINTIKTMESLKYKVLVVGGIHATLCPEEYIDIADIVLIGEAEEAFLKLVEKVLNGKEYWDIKNLWIRRNGEVVKNEIGPFIKNLDELPLPDYSPGVNLLTKGKLVKLDRRFSIDYGIGQEGGIFLVEARGCAKRCSFCIHSTNYHGRFRKKSIEQIIEYLKMVRSEDPTLQFVYFMEDDFFLRTNEEIRKFAGEYINKVNLPFFLYCTPETVTEEKLKLLVKAGLKILNMGIQTGSERINRLIFNRNSSNSRVLGATRIIAKYSDKTQLLYDFIISNPYETKQDLLATIELIKKIPKPFNLHLHYLVFFKGTTLYKKALEDGIIDDKYSKSRFDFHIPKYHLKRDGNFYLNSVISWLNGPNRDNKYGLLPLKILEVLISEKYSKFFQKFPMLISFLNKILPIQRKKTIIVN